MLRPKSGKKKKSYHSKVLSFFFWYINRLRLAGIFWDCDQQQIVICHCAYLLKFIGCVRYYDFTGSKFHEIASFDTCIGLRPLKGFQRLEDSGNELCKKTNCTEICTKAAPCQNIKTRSGLQEYSLKNFKIFLALELDGPSDPIT